MLTILILQKEGAEMHDTLEQKKRQDWIDIVKFWGMIAIVWGHTLDSGDVHRYLYSFHIPLFFFVIGLFFTSPKLSFWRFTIKKAKSLLIPYFSFAIISVLIFFVLGNLASITLNEDTSENSLSANLLEILTGNCRANRPLWFLPCMFCCYILCFAISRIVKSRPIYIKRIVAFSVAVVSFAICFLNEEFLNINALFFKVDVAIFMLAFVSVGYLVKPLLLKRFNVFVAALLAIPLLIAGGITAFGNSTIMYLSNNYRNVPLFFISAILTIMGFCILSILISRCNLKIITAPLVYVGKRTLPILLMHKFPILFFQVIVPWTKQSMAENDPFIGLVVAIISIAMCLGVDMLMIKIKGMLHKKPIRNA